jgi:alkylhydroperoxidase/carboxymuconolactone decarboxylase family protein YurZ
MTKLSQEQRELREEVIRTRGKHRNPFWEDLLTLDPDFLEKCLAFLKIKGVLSPRVQELIYIAIAASCTLLWEPGLRAHLKKAFDVGVTKEEVMEVLQLVSVLGTHTLALGVPLLMEEAKAHGVDLEGPLSERQQAIKDRLLGSGRKSTWLPMWEGMLRLDPAFMETTIDFIEKPWKDGPLAPKEKEFIYIAIDASVTHLYEDGLQRHIRRALDFGASSQEILEVLELVAGSGGTISVAVAVPLLAEEIESRA